MSSVISASSAWRWAAPSSSAYTLSNQRTAAPGSPDLAAASAAREAASFFSAMVAAAVNFCSAWPSGDDLRASSSARQRSRCLAAPAARGWSG
jgi:hypothetical protein